MMSKNGLPTGRVPVWPRLGRSSHGRARQALVRKVRIRLAVQGNGRHGRQSGQSLQSMPAPDLGPRAMRQV